MGLKSGSRDAELDDEAGSSEGEETQQDRDEETVAGATETTSKTPEQSTAQPSKTERTEQQTQETGTQEAESQETNRPTMDQIPYVLRRNKVNEGREQKPFFIRPEVFEEAQLRDDIESMIGEKPPKSDVREASMIAAQRNPELVAEILREWGYDLDQS